MPAHSTFPSQPPYATQFLPWRIRRTANRHEIQPTASGYSGMQTSELGGASDQVVPNMISACQVRLPAAASNRNFAASRPSGKQLPQMSL